MKSSLVLVAILFLTMAYLPQSLCAAPGRTIEKSFPVPMGGKLVLDLDTGGNVEIAGWDKPEIAVTVAIGGDDADRVTSASRRARRFSGSIRIARSAATRTSICTSRSRCPTSAT